MVVGCPPRKGASEGAVRVVPPQRLSVNSSADGPVSAHAQAPMRAHAVRRGRRDRHPEGHRSLSPACVDPASLERHSGRSTGCSSISSPMLGLWSPVQRHKLGRGTHLWLSLGQSTYCWSCGLSSCRRGPASWCWALVEKVKDQNLSFAPGGACWKSLGNCPPNFFE